MTSPDLNYIKQYRREDAFRYYEFDEKYNVNTSHPFTKDKDGNIIPGIYENFQYNGSNGYQRAAEFELDKINEFFYKQQGIENYLFVDIGSGKGKVILYNILKEAPYKDYIGIEIDELLHSVALDNFQLTGIKVNKNVKLLNMDILDYDIIDTPSVYFMFYPFSKEIFQKFINKNLDKIRQTKSYLVFINEADFDVSNAIGADPIFDYHSITIYQ